MNKKAQISMEYLLIIGVILVIAAGAVLVMTKFNLSRTSEESITKSEETLTQSMMTFGKVAVTTIALDTTNLQFTIQNNNDQIIQITGAHICDATSSDCTVGASSLTCTSGTATDINIGGSQDVKGCAHGLSLTRGNSYKVKVMLKFTKGTSTIETPTSPQTVRLTAA